MTPRKPGPVRIVKGQYAGRVARLVARREHHATVQFPGAASRDHVELELSWLEAIHPSERLVKAVA